MKRYRAETSATIERLAEMDNGSRSLTYELRLKGTFSPGHPMPCCSDHDHPDFSDPGECPNFEVNEIEIEDVRDQDGEEVKWGHPLFGYVLRPNQIELTQDEELDAISRMFDNDR